DPGKIDRRLAVHAGCLRRVAVERMTRDHPHAVVLPFRRMVVAHGRSPSDRYEGYRGFLTGATGLLKRPDGSSGVNEASSATDADGRVGAWPRLAASAQGFYALSVYLPVSLLARRLRDRSRARRGVQRDTHATALPQVAWNEILARYPIRLVEADKADGHANLAALAILAQAAPAIPPPPTAVELRPFHRRP